MKKIVLITLFVASVLVSNLALAVSEGGTGAPGITGDNMQTVPGLLQWLLSYWPF